tara:strand:- start:65 stop:706 length:642 start_codon:yes stop_codon:yes gene_type:complete
MKKVILVLAMVAFASCNNDARELKKAQKIETARINDSIQKAEVRLAKEAEELRQNNRLKAIDSLKPNFDIKIDEFTGIGWVEPKNRPKYTNRNGIYSYFQIDENGKSKNLRLRIQYYGDDWIFFDKVYFSFDGENFTLPVSNKKTDHGGGKVWEWIDDSVVDGGVREKFLLLLATSKSPRMKLQGDTDSRVKTITESQLKALRETISLYFAMQ